MPTRTCPNCGQRNINGGHRCLDIRSNMGYTEKTTHHPGTHKVGHLLKNCSLSFCGRSNAIDTFLMIQRMDGLVSMVIYDNLICNSESICRDLLEEGFEVEDIMEYFSYKLRNQIKAVQEDMADGKK